MRLGVAPAVIVLVLVACSQPPPKPVEVPLEIKPVPVSSSTPIAAPIPPPDPPRHNGDCGDPKVGSAAPPLEGKSLEKGNISLTSGRVALVMFWATWCGPCTKEMPEVQRIYSAAASRGLDVIAISVDDDVRGVGDFVKDHGVHYPVIWDEGHAISECWRPPTMPWAVIVDRAGIVRYVHDGYHAGEETAIKREIDSLL